MKITLSQIHYDSYNHKVSNPVKANRQDSLPELQKLSGSEIPFCAMHGIKPSKLNVIEEKFKLARQIRDMLDQRKKYSQEEVTKVVFAKYESGFKKAFRNILESCSIDEILSSDKYLEKSKDLIVSVCEKVQQDCDKLTAELKLKDKNDYELLSKLHAAVLSDDMELEKVYKSHYSPLERVKKIPELLKELPKLEIPEGPKETISKKIVGIFDRDFFIKFDELRENHSLKEAKKLFEEKFGAIIKHASNESKADEGFLTKTLKRATYKEFLKTYEIRKAGYGFNSMGQNVKVPKNLITEDDIKLLSVDYDKFVIDVLRQQYLEGKKLAQIVYREGDVILEPKKLVRSGYKFEKTDEKIKSFIKKAQEIKRAERSYEAFGDEQLQDVLTSYGNKEIANHEEILDRLIKFSDVQFAEGDRAPMIRFLRILDDISDGKITTEEGVKMIKAENLRPHGTEKLNKAEKEKLLAEMKKAQEIDADFRAYCRDFDNVIGVLYRSQMEEVATLCSAYRPKNVEDSRDFSDAIIKLVRDGMKDGGFINHKETEAQLKYLNKCYHYKLYESKNPLYQRALEFGRDAEGKIDEIKVGHYITSSETVAQYPANKNLYEPFESNIIDVICTKSASTEDAVKTLIKFDNYRMLPTEEKMKISTIQQYFDLNSTTGEKEVLERIINDIYVPNSTPIETVLNFAGTQTVQSEFVSSSKQQIMEDLKFPLCLKYFDTFERYMTRVGRSKDDYGIQIIGTNNKELRKYFKQEVKVPMDERLYSTAGDYRFDVYKPGLHKAKNSKA